MSPVSLDYTPLKHFSKRLADLATLHDIPADLARAKVRKAVSKTRLVHASSAFLVVALWQSFWQRTATDVFESSGDAFPDAATYEAQRTKLRRTLRYFNTPDAKNIDRLIRVSTGIPRISDSWVLPDATNAEIRSRLEAILQLRHRIAHTDIRDIAFSRDENVENMRLLYALAERSTDTIDAHLRFPRTTTGPNP